MYDYESEAHQVAVGRVSRAQFLRRGLAAGLSATFLGQVLAGCGGDETNGTTAGSGAPSGPRTPMALDKKPTAPFDPNVKAGLKPKLPRRVGFPLPAGGEYFTEVSSAAKIGAEAGGLEYITAQASGDSPKQFQHAQDMLSRGLAGLIIFDSAPPALQPLQKKAIEDGVAVMCGPMGVSTCQVTADQYKIGHANGSAAVKWIKEQGGNAEVALFNQDIVPSQKPRYKGVRDALKEGGPGIKLVSDTGISSGEPAEGQKLTNAVLQRHPNVSVWIGGDSILTGTLSALEAAGKVRDETGLFGINGDAEVLDAIAKGGPFKSTQGFGSVYAYALGYYVAEWLEGKSIPLVLNIEAVEVSSKETAEAFKQANAEPAAAFEENQETHKYVTPLGNTSYEQHRYLTITV